jgi:hypothetical protein
MLRQKIAVTENGKTRRLAALEVMLRRLVNDAMRSDAKAMKLLLALVDRYAETTEPRFNSASCWPRIRPILAQYLLEPKAPAGELGEQVNNEEEGDAD